MLDPISFLERLWFAFAVSGSNQGQVILPYTAVQCASGCEFSKRQAPDEPAVIINRIAVGEPGKTAQDSGRPGFGGLRFVRNLQPRQGNADKHLYINCRLELTGPSGRLSPARSAFSTKAEEGGEESLFPCLLPCRPSSSSKWSAAKQCEAFPRH